MLGEETAPSTQMLLYMRRSGDITDWSLRWGILTSGSKWRLHYSGAHSVSEQFLELDIAAFIDLSDYTDRQHTLDERNRLDRLSVFHLIFRRDAFVPSGTDPRTFHERAIDEGNFHEKPVAGDLSNKLFEEVFPDLTRATVGSASEADRREVRQAAPVTPYRLLFILYAEDGDLLPIRDSRYDDCGLRV